MKIFQLFQVFPIFLKFFADKFSTSLPNLTKILTFRLLKNYTKRWRRDRSMHAPQSNRDQSRKESR